MDTYCTLVYSDGYVPGALVLGSCLREYDPQVNRIVLITEQVSLGARRALGKVYAQVRLIEPIAAPDTPQLELLDRPELAAACTKLRVWQLTEYKRVVYLDADTLPLASLAHLFDELPLGAGIAASPDIGWPDIFNSGVFVTEPSLITFDKLVDLVYTGESFDGSDQGLLNTYFQNWHRLKFTYNVTASASYQYAPAYERFKKDIKVFHFIGKQKPWNSFSNDEMTQKWRSVQVPEYQSTSFEQDSSAGSPGSPSGHEAASNSAPKEYETAQPTYDEKKLVAPAPNRWDPVHFEPPVISEPEAAAFDESRATSEEPPAFEFMKLGKPVFQFPWETKAKRPTRVFPSGYD